MRISCCRRRMLSTRQLMDGCVWTYDARCRGTWSTSERSQLSKWAQRAYLWFNMHKFYGGWLNVGPKKPTKLSKLSSECLRGDGCLPRTIRYIYILYRAMYASNTGARGHMLPQVFSLFHIYPVLQMKFYILCAPRIKKSFLRLWLDMIVSGNIEFNSWNLYTRLFKCFAAV